MKLNSLSFELKDQFTIIGLFAGCGEFKPEVHTKVYRSCIHLDREYDVTLWEEHSELSFFKNAYMPIWQSDDVEETIAYGFQKISIKLDMHKHIRLAKAVLKQRIVEHFKKLSMPVGNNMTGSPEVWIQEQEDNEKIIFQRYTLTPKWKDQTDEWQLDVNAGSRSVVSKQCLYDVPLDETSFFVLVDRREVVRRNMLTQRQMNADELFPVVNNENKTTLGLNTEFTPDPDKYRTLYQKINTFINEYLNTNSFCEDVQVRFTTGQLMEVKPSNLFTVNKDAKQLVFGNGATGTNIKELLKDAGPYLRVSKQHTFFFIYPKNEECKSVVMRIQSILQRGEDPGKTDYNKFTSLGRRQRNQLLWESGLSFAYSNYETAIEEIQAKLQNEKYRKADRTYLAIVVTDIKKDDKDEPKRQLYFDMKELLLKHSITSQVLYKDDVNHSYFSCFLDNIAAALIAKQDGMAWSVNNLLGKNDLIIGVGAYYQRGEKPYLGSAFCFNNSGKMMDHDFCRAGNTEDIRRNLASIISRFCRTSGIPDRLIIHYYKDMSNKEAKPIEDMLYNWKLKCPVYVVNVVTSANHDLIAFDMSQPRLMPLSGTFVKLRRSCYLLYNNEHYIYNESKAKVLMPIKVKISRAGNRKNENITMQTEFDIVTQVYQFCRLYSKSITMQNEPITTAYPKMLAECVHHFKDTNLPEYARKHLWML